MPARLKTWPTPEELARVVRHPSAHAPTASEVLTPPLQAAPHLPPCPEALHPLLQAVLARPDDDAPRRAFADALHATDPTRATFIRRQLANPQIAETVENPAEFSPWGARDVQYRRGFAERLSMTGRAFVALADSLFAATPVREVRFVAVRHLFAELVQSSSLAKLRVIDLDGNRIGRSGLTLLARSPHLIGTQRLSLTRNSLADDCIDTLSQASWAKPLAELLVSAEEFSADGQRRLRADFGNRLLLA